MRPNRPSEPSVTTGECVRDWPAKLRCREGLTPQKEEDALAHRSVATEACQPKTVRTREGVAINARATNNTVDGQTSNHARNVWVGHAGRQG
jgi:hypothetical protein